MMYPNSALILYIVYLYVRFNPLNVKAKADFTKSTNKDSLPVYNKKRINFLLTYSLFRSSLCIARCIPIPVGVVNHVLDRRGSQFYDFNFRGKNSQKSIRCSQSYGIVWQFVLLGSKGLGGCSGVLQLNWAKRPFRSSLVPLFQTDSSCKTFQMKLSLICIKMNL